MKKSWLWLTAILVIIFIALRPCIDNDFTNWDDPKYILENHVIKDLTPERIRRVFMDEEKREGLYVPLTTLTWMLEYHFYRLDAHPYHRDNLIIHLLNTALVFWLIILLNQNLFIAAVTSLLFGIHPMHVESVAWITERKDVLYTFFFLASVISYLYYCAAKKMQTGFYLLALLLFLLSLLSKPAAVTLPLVIVLADYLSGRNPQLTPDKSRGDSLFGKLRLSRIATLDKIPFFALSLAWGVLTAKITGGVASPGTFTLLDRLLFANYGICHYLWKLIYPFNLSCFVPYPNLVNGRLPLIYYLVPFIVLSAAYLIYRSTRHTRAVVFGSLFFLSTIALMLQFIPVGPNIVCDRYTYMSYIGLFYIAGHSVRGWLYSGKAYLQRLRPLVWTGIICYCAMMAYLAHERCKVWKNSETLWTNVIGRFPNTPEGYLNRGQYYTDNDQFDKALKDYEVVLRLKPEQVLAWINRGNVYGRRNEFDKALENYSRAIELDPTASKIFLNRGNVYGLQGKHDLAIADFTKALELENNYLDAYVNRAISWSYLRQFDNALTDFNRALEIDPTASKVYAMRAYAYLDSGQLDISIQEYTKLMQSEPRNAQYCFYRGLAFQKKDQFQQAIDDYSHCLRLNPADGSALLNLAICREALGNFKEALQDVLMARKLGQAVSEEHVERLRNIIGK